MSGECPTTLKIKNKLEINQVSSETAAVQEE